MRFRTASFLLSVFPVAALMLQAQTPAAAPPGPPVAAPHAPPSVVAGIPVNYDEAKVGTYTLPDPLRLDDGKTVRNAKTWWTKRRPQIVALFETQQYGIAPGRPADESFKLVEKGMAFEGKAIRKQVTISFSNDPAWPAIHLLVYLPAAAKKPVPMYFTISFAANQCATDDPGIIPEKTWDPRTKTKVMPLEGRCIFGHIPVERLLDAGFGVATFYYGDVDPDFLGGFKDGIGEHYLKPGADRARTRRVGWDRAVGLGHEPG